MVSKTLSSVLLPAILLLSACAVDDTFPVPAPESVVPALEHSREPAVLTIKGSGFYIQPVRQLSRGSGFKTNNQFKLVLKGRTRSGDPITITLQNVKHIDAQTLEGTLPKDSPAGTYAVEVISPSGRAGTSANVFEISEGPDVFNVAEADRETDTPNPKNSDSSVDAPDIICEADDVCDANCANSVCDFGCSSSADCNYSCQADECNLLCTDDSACNLACRARACDAKCHTTKECSLTCDASLCSAQNTGSGTMFVVCDSGICNVTCPNTAACIVTCVDIYNCDVQCQNLIQCDSTTYACNTTCP